MSNPVVETLRDLGDAFAADALRWFLFGAQAALIYGSRRLTHDVDVTVLTGDSTALSDRLQAHGFVLRVEDVDGFVARTRVLPMTHQATGMPVDVVLGGPGFEEYFWENRSQVEIGGINVPVVRAVDLVLLKLLAGRPHDLEDARAVIAAGANVDEIRVLVDSAVEALGEDDVRRRLAEVLGRDA